MSPKKGSAKDSMEKTKGTANIELKKYAKSKNATEVCI